MITLPYPPSANRYWRIFRGRATPSKAATDYKKAVAILADMTLLDGPLALTITLHPKQCKDGSDSKVLIDLDNCLKVALDALQGIAYENDRQVRKISASYGDSLPNGGLTISVSPLQ